MTLENATELGRFLASCSGALISLIGNNNFLVPYENSLFHAWEIFTTFPRNLGYYRCFKSRK